MRRDVAWLNIGSGGLDVGCGVAQWWCVVAQWWVQRFSMMGATGLHGECGMKWRGSMVGKRGSVGGAAWFNGGSGVAQW